MLANIHVFILTSVTFISLLGNLSQILDAAFLLFDLIPYVPSTIFQLYMLKIIGSF